MHSLGPSTTQCDGGSASSLPWAYLRKKELIDPNASCFLLTWTGDLADSDNVVHREDFTLIIRVILN